MSVPIATPKQIFEMDQIMNDTYHVSTEQLMEVAGLRVAEIIRDSIVNALSSTHIVIAVGKGNNGGDGLVAARFLAGWGAQVSVVLVASETELSDLSKKHLVSLKALDVVIEAYAPKKNNWSRAHIIVDALLGCGLHNAPTGEFAEIIKEINDAQKMVVAVDIPSGLDGTSGEIYEPCIQARYTISVAALKKGMQDQKAKSVCGRIFVCDIGIPQEVYKKVNVAF